MKVVVVTGRAPHHLALCSFLDQRFDVAAILHPLDPPTSLLLRLRKLRRQFERNGLVLGFLNLWSRARESSPSAKEAIHSATGYSKISRAKIYDRCEVRSPESAKLIASLKPDVTLFLGGPVYPPEFIAQSGLALNFHSGLSPVYNGASSIKFAFANGQPHLCGGTLMQMNERVDGGAILAHYLPEIGSGDTPDSLFQKTVRAAPILYYRILEHLNQTGAILRSISQPTPLFYYRSSDFGHFQRLMIDRYVNQDLSARYSRAESVREYWRESSEDMAVQLYRETLDGLLWPTKRAPKG